MAMLNCSQIAKRDHFDTYFQTLLNVTNGEVDSLWQCRPEVCSALWGQGNPDISGIGMLIGYFLEQALGLALVVGTLLSAIATKHPTLTRSTLRALESFHDCATFFAFSIEIASVIVLVSEDFGVSTSGMGDESVRITQAVAMLVLLPLLYRITMVPAWTLVSHSSPSSEQDEAEETKEEAEQTKRFALFVLCWLLALYAFYSKMNAAFGPNQIPINDWESQFAAIKGMCSAGVIMITASEDMLMTAVVIITFVPISLFVLGSITLQGLRKHHRDSALYVALYKRQKKLDHEVLKLAFAVGFAWLIFCVCGLLWSVIRAQQYQEAMATMTGAGDSDRSWTFGQVVALTVFTPVVVDCWSMVVEARGARSQALADRESAGRK